MGDIEIGKAVFFESHSESLDNKTKDCIEKFIQKMDSLLKNHIVIF